jgi:Conjugative transposon protein TcpC
MTGLRQDERASASGARESPGDALPRIATAWLEPQPLWRLRLWQRVARLLLVVAVLAIVVGVVHGLLVRSQLAPTGRTPAVSQPDLAAAGFASLFARAYLSWNADEPEAHRRSLAPFVGSALTLEAGAELPLRGSQRVVWDEVVQERAPRPDLRVFTVAADTSPGGVEYLAVSVVRRADEKLAIASYPAFVGPPSFGGADPVALEGSEVDDLALSTVVTRALSNYLSASSSELAADLVAGAQISTPTQPLRLEGVQRLTWAVGAGVIESVGSRGTASKGLQPGASTDREGTVVALVAATDVAGAHLTLAYEVEVRRVAGRWEVAAIEMDPDA